MFPNRYSFGDQRESQAMAEDRESGTITSLARETAKMAGEVA